ncbi:MAG TPA: DegT/DnrJ/EryC1/StrS family aminotransferase [Chthoniobacteraceae bacterium]|nr:DegT/DnrJ/EryC1/StrS family aminotransferase [Chthoniobacteraceae bacterium]
MTHAIEQLESRLCDQLGRKHCVVAGRGATAIYLALRALPAKRGKVVLPSILCPSPASAVLYAGLEPIFCDVSLSDFNMDPGSLERVLAAHDDVVAVMPVHLFGQSAPMREIAEIARHRGLCLIEDAAQAFGGSSRGAKLGSLGDISILSFGHTKIVDVGWGGAALTDDDALAARMREELRDIPPCPPNIGDLYAEYRRVYYSLRPLTELNPRLHALFVPIPFLYREMHLFTLDPEKARLILAALDGLDDAVAARRANAREYRRRLQHPDLLHPALDEEDAPWRYSFLVRSDRQKALTARLREARIDVSNWYPPLHPWYESGRAQDPANFPNADFVGKHVVNLWVEPRITAEDIRRTCECALRFLDE